MISSYYLRNNVSLVIGVIQTILKSGRSFSLAELSLLLPFLLDEKIVSVMLNPNEEYTLGSLITKNNIAQRESLLALTLWKRILDIIERLLAALSELMAINVHETISMIAAGQTDLGKMIGIAKLLSPDSLESTDLTNLDNMQNPRVYRQF